VDIFDSVFHVDGLSCGSLGRKKGRILKCVKKLCYALCIFFQAAFVRTIRQPEKQSIQQKSLGKTPSDFAFSGCLKLGEPFKDDVAVGRREDFVGGSLGGQPCVGGVFAEFGHAACGDGGGKPMPPINLSTFL